MYGRAIIVLVRKMEIVRPSWRKKRRIRRFKYIHTYAHIRTAYSRDREKKKTLKTQHNMKQKQCVHIYAHCRMYSRNIEENVNFGLCAAYSLSYRLVAFTPSTLEHSLFLVFCCSFFDSLSPSKMLSRPLNVYVCGIGCGKTICRLMND